MSAVLVSFCFLCVHRLYHPTQFRTAKLLRKSLPKPLDVTVFSSLAAFKIMGFHPLFAIWITRHFVVDDLGKIWLGALCASWIWTSVSFPRPRKVSAMTYANNFSISFPFSPPSGIPLRPMLLHLLVLLNSPIIFHFYHNFFSLLSSVTVFHHSVFRITDPFACSRLLCVPRNGFGAHSTLF